jgi:hypothetical protein
MMYTMYLDWYLLVMNSTRSLNIKTEGSLLVKTSSVLLLFLTSTLILPFGFSGVRADQSTNANQISSDTSQTISFGFSNQTNSAVAENIGMLVSNFVHNATVLFHQEKTENIQAIKECHQKIQNATSENRTQVIDECHATMNVIREKYQNARTQFQELFKQFRKNIIVLRHQAEGLHVSEQDLSGAIRNINEGAAKHGLGGIAIALGHLRGMGENGKMGIERALMHVNETSNTNTVNLGQPTAPYVPSTPAHSSTLGSRGTQSTPVTPVTPSIPAYPPNLGSHGPPAFAGQSGSHGKH